MTWKRRVYAIYSEMASVIVGGILVVVALNLLAVPLLRRMDDQVTGRYGRDLVATAYPGLEEAEREELLRESWSRPFAFQPFVQYQETPFAGRFVNVNEAGYRESLDPGPWPLAPENLNVFVFGGSTTFGYGVPDDQTVASYLQTSLGELIPDRKVKCYNFARGGYYSSLERTLFSELLVAGHRPDLVIFVDGINDFFYQDPKFTDQLQELLGGGVRSVAKWTIKFLPFIRLSLLSLRVGLGKNPTLLDESRNVPSVLDARIERYLSNVRMTEHIANAYGALPVFVVQPTPTYKYDTSHHPFAMWGFGRHSLSAYGYPRLAERVREKPPGESFIWAADIQEELREPLYVDLAHYSPKLAKLLAAEIVRQVGQRSLLERVPRLTQSP